MSAEPRWVSKSAVLAIHATLLAIHGGPSGVRDEALLDSALAAPKNAHAYGEPDLFDLAANYAHAITRNHPFADGNKRLALTIAGVFLELNGYRLAASEPEAVAATVALSSRRLTVDAYAAWLRDSSKRKRSAARRPSGRPKRSK
ncbi:MAG: type II toxin-antitoxin system death-on-curing family toxin [Candidatus Eisenbacteria bacterium]